MSDVVILLARCRELGAEFFPLPDGKPKVRAPAPLPEELREQLRQRKPESAAAMIQLSHIHLMLRKLAPSAQREFRYAVAA